MATTNAVCTGKRIRKERRDADGKSVERWTGGNPQSLIATYVRTKPRRKNASA